MFYVSFIGYTRSSVAAVCVVSVSFSMRFWLLLFVSCVIFRMYFVCCLRRASSRRCIPADSESRRTPYEIPSSHHKHTFQIHCNNPCIGCHSPIWLIINHRHSGSIRFVISNQLLSKYAYARSFYCGFDNIKETRLHFDLFFKKSRCNAECSARVCTDAQWNNECRLSN